MYGFPDQNNQIPRVLGCGFVPDVKAKPEYKTGWSVFKPKLSMGDDGLIAMVNDAKGNMIGLRCTA